MCALHIENLCKSFNGLAVVKNITAAFGDHSVITVIGPNGSGKTTLIKSVLGLVIPDSGKIIVGDEEIDHSWNYRSKIGYMPQINRFPDNINVKQVFEMIKDIRKHDGVLDEELYTQFELEKIADKKMSVLSGGMRQKVNAALAFLFDPLILILDEPTAGLDPVSSELLKNKIVKSRDLGKLILITTHNMNDVDELADKLLLMTDGTIKFFGTPNEMKLKTGSEKLSKALIKAYAENGNV